MGMKEGADGKGNLPEKHFSTLPSEWKVVFYTCSLCILVPFHIENIAVCIFMYK